MAALLPSITWLASCVVRVSGQAGGYDYQKYVPEAAGGAGGVGYKQYMQAYAGGGRGAASYSDFQYHMQGGGGDHQQYVPGGGYENAASAGSGYQQDMNGGAALSGSKSREAKPQGFSKYLQTYLPKGDDAYVNQWTDSHSDASASCERMYSGMYDQYVDLYSHMAGDNVSSGGSWQAHSASQQAAFNDAVGRPFGVLKGLQYTGGGGQGGTSNGVVRQPPVTHAGGAGVNYSQYMRGGGEYSKYMRGGRAGFNDSQPLRGGRNYFQSAQGGGAGLSHSQRMQGSGFNHSHGEQALGGFVAFGGLGADATGSPRTTAVLNLRNPLAAFMLLAPLLLAVFTARLRARWAVALDGEDSQYLSLA